MPVIPTIRVPIPVTPTLPPDAKASGCRGSRRRGARCGVAARGKLQPGSLSTLSWFEQPKPHPQHLLFSSYKERYTRIGKSVDGGQ